MKRIDRTLVLALVTLTVTAFGVHIAEAQFAPPTCVPPACNPTVIQNIPLTGTPQTASFNITGDAGVGAKMEAGRQLPTFTAATDYLFFGNLNAGSTAGYLMALQVGGSDRLKVGLLGQMQLPLGSVGAPSYSFLGDTNTGLYSNGADRVDIVSNGVTRTFINNSGTTINSGVLSVPTGSPAAPSITFTGDTNTGIYRSAADTLNFVTNGVTGMFISSTNSVVIPNTMQVNGTLAAAGGMSGDGSGLTNLNATNLASGTVPSGRISGTYSNAVTFNNASNAFTGAHTGDGSGLTNLNATNLTSGTVPDGRLSGTYTGALTFNNAANSFTGVGTGLTALNGTNITSGTVATARLPATVVYTNTVQTISGVKTFSGDNSHSGMTSFGSAALVTGAGQNMLYGVQDVTSAGNLFLLQSENAGVFSDEFRVAGSGDTTISGNLNVTGTISGTVTEADTLQSVTDRGNVTTTSIQASSMGAGTAPAAGRGLNAQGSSYGVYGLSVGGVTTGVYGYGDTYGVNGGATGGVGGYFTSNTSYGAYGGSNSNIGVYGYGAPGVRGEGFGAASMGGVFKSGGTGDSLRVIAPTAGNSFIIRNNADTSTVFNVNQAGSVTVGTVPWARLSAFPAACPAGQHVSAVGGTLTCAAVVNSVVAGAGISVSGATGNVTIANTGDPDPADDVTGGGTADYLSKFTGANSIGDSLIFEDTTQGYLGIGTTTPGKTFEVRNGDMGTYSGNIAASFGTVSAYLVAAGGSAMSGQAVGVSSIGVTGVGGGYGVYGSGDYGGYFVGDDNFGGAGVYAEWTGTGAGGGVKGYTTRPAAWAGWFEATDSTNSLTRGLYTSAPTTSGAKALWVAGDAHVTNDLRVVNLATITFPVITQYATFTELGADPSSSEGRFAYVNNKFRCNENGTWVNCASFTGSGTTNYLPKFTGASALGNSQVFDNGTNVGIGTASPGATLHVVGSGSYGIYVAGTPSWGVYSTKPIEAAGTTFALGGTAAGGAGATYGTANGTGIVYGVRGTTTATTDVNSAGVYGSGQNGVFGYSNVAGGVGVKGQAFTSAVTGVHGLVSASAGAANTTAVLAGNTSTIAVTNTGINSQATGVNAGTNIGAYLSASGATNNYSLVTVLGNVGFFDQTPSSPVVVGTDGSAAAPAFAVGAGDDSNTGFFHPAADTIAMSTAGTERLRLDSAGNMDVDANTLYVDATNNRVGIGTASPSFKLAVNEAGGTNGIEIIGDGAGDNRLKFDNLTAIDGYIFQHASDGNRLVIEGETLGFNTNGANRRMVIDAAGNVGIGTSSPTDTLDVNGDIHLSGGAKEIRFLNAGGSVEQYVWLSGTSLGMGRGGASNSIFVTSAGNVGIGTTTPYSFLSLKNDLSHNKLTLYETSSSYSYGMGVVSGQFSLHVAHSGARFAFYADAAATTEIFTIYGNGNINAPYNTWGTGDGWHYCYSSGSPTSYCTCTNGSFVGQLWYSGSTIATYCYKP